MAKLTQAQRTEGVSLQKRPWLPGPMPMDPAHCISGSAWQPV